MTRVADSTGYSSDIRLSLRVGDRVFNVGQVLPDRCMVRDPDDTEPGPAELIISIDGDEEIKKVNLTNGIQAGVREVLYSRPVS